MTAPEILGIAFYVFCGICLLFTLLGSFFNVPTARAVIITRLGVYSRTASAGALQLKLPWIESVHEIDLQVLTLETKVETKTRDNAMVTIPVAVQYSVSDPYKSLYRLEHPETQISSFVENIILGHVPSLTLDEVFMTQSQIALATTKELAAQIEDFGFMVNKVLITEITPGPAIVESLNAVKQAEAEYTLAVRKSEGEAEAAKNHGKGVADERIEIARGIAESSRVIKEANPDVPDHEVLLTLLATQWTETQKAIGTSENSTTVFLNSSPGATGEMIQQLQATIMHTKED